MKKSFPWQRYSRKLHQRILEPKFAGVLEAGEGRLAIGEEGALNEGNALCVYLRVDERDGTILESRFQAFGETALIGAADAAMEVLIGKNYDQARRLSADLIDAILSDHEGESAFPQETYAHLNLVLSAVEEAALQCSDIPLPESYVATPIAAGDGLSGEAVEYPGWKELSVAQKLTVLNEVLEKEVRPFVQLDAGDVKIVKLEDNEITIGYEGSCTTCYSSIGSTLSGIQKILQNRVHPDLTVVPDMDSLSL